MTYLVIPLCNVDTKDPRFYLLSLFFANGPLEILLIHLRSKDVLAWVNRFGLVYYLRIDVQLRVDIKVKLSIDFISLSNFLSIMVEATLKELII